MDLNFNHHKNMNTKTDEELGEMFKGVEGMPSVESLCIKGGESVKQ
jgi:hypothetical protein